jgi:predicted nucleic acid-binding protein
VRFWDSSAVIPLLIVERRTDAAQALVATDRVMTVWWGTEVECVSAIARQERREGLSQEAMQGALGLLETLVDEWDEMQPNASLRRTARRLLRVHDLRAADGLQLAAAIDASEGNPAALPFVTLDLRLADAARREGFSVIVPAAPTP